VHIEQLPIYGIKELQSRRTRLDSTMTVGYDVRILNPDDF